MKKFLRLVVFGLLIIISLIVVAVILGLTPSVQTWAARRATAGQGIGIGRVAVGLDKTRVEEVRVVRPGLALALPLAEVEVSLIDAARSRVAVRRIVAKGWTLDLTAGANMTSAATKPAEPAASARAAFEGLFKQLQLPVDLSLDSLEIEGDVILPEGRVHVTLDGGQLGAGKEGLLSLKNDITLSKKDSPVSTVVVRSEIHVRMDTPRSFEHFSVTTTATAKGAQFPNGVGAQITLNAVRADKGAESYALVLKSEGRELANFGVQLPAGAAPLTGTWKLDVRDADLAPFAFGRPLPAFAATGQGTFSTDRVFSEIHATGLLGATASRLASVSPQFAAVGQIKFAADFDVTRQGDTLRIARFLSTVSGEQPVLRVEVMQTFALNTKTRAVTAASPTDDLFLLNVQGVPLAWAQPFIPGLAVAGNDLRGEFAAVSRDGGFSLRSVAPLTLSNLTVAQAGKPLVRAIDATIGLNADYTPKGWQAEIPEFSIRSEENTLVRLTARVGQLTGDNQAIKVTGSFEAGLPALLAQPVAPTGLMLSRGVARGEFTVRATDKQEVEFTLQLAELAAAGQVLPEVAVYMRVDRDATGRIDAQVPVVVTQAGRKSDLTIGAVVQTPKTGVQVDAQLKSEALYIEDIKRFAGLMPASAPDSVATLAASVPAASKHADKQAGPPWAGISGELKLALKKVVYSSAFQLTDVGGAVKITPAMLSLENLRVVLGADGTLKAAGSLNYDAKVATPYELKADINVTGFDPAPLLRALDPSKPAQVEGKFDLSTHLAGRADDPSGFKDTALGDVILTSRGGIVRALSVEAANTVETTSKVAAVAGLFGALTGNATASKYAAQGQASVAVARQLSVIRFDQLNIVVSRDEKRNVTIKDITLISPAMRLVGSGKITYEPGVPLSRQPLLINLQLGARDQLAEGLRALKLIDGPADSLGYLPLAEPIKLDGSLQAIGTRQLSRLINRALTN